MSSAEILSPDIVNTGLTRRCATDNEVVIYRQEEWFKVLIHELIHGFGLDFHSSDDITIANGGQLFLDGGSDTYLTTDGENNTIKFFANDTEHMKLHSDYGMKYGRVYRM